MKTVSYEMFKKYVKENNLKTKESFLHTYFVNDKDETKAIRWQGTCGNEFQIDMTDREEVVEIINSFLNR